MRRIILIVIFLLPFIYWGISILKCEYLTYQYGKQFEMFFQKENLHFGDVAYLKVLDYSDTTARIYYVWKYNKIENGGGSIVKFTKKDGRWVTNSLGWCVWSKQGNADDFMWPCIR